MQKHIVIAAAAVAMIAGSAFDAEAGRFNRRHRCCRPCSPPCPPPCCVPLDPCSGTPSYEHVTSYSPTVATHEGSVVSEPGITVSVGHEEPAPQVLSEEPPSLSEAGEIEPPSLSEAADVAVGGDSPTVEPPAID